MTRRKTNGLTSGDVIAVMQRTEAVISGGEHPIVPPVVTLDPAMPFADLIERRYRDLLSLCTDPKDLTNALKAASEWHQARHAMESNNGWGSKLKGTMA